MIQDTSRKSENPDFRRILHDQAQIIEFMKSIASILELDALIEGFLHMSLAQARCSKAMVFIKQGIYHFNDLELHRQNIGIPELDTAKHRIKYNTELTIALTRSTYPIHLGTYKGILDIDEETIKLFRHCSEDPLLAPMFCKGQLSGLLVLGTRMDLKYYSSYDRHFLSNLCTVAAITVENAKLHKFATEDSLTKLKMRRIFEYYLQYYFTEMQTNPKLKISIILIDIDFFKKVNDHFGHLYGDFVLYEVAQEVLRQIPTSAIASRYGGEEFAIILPKTELEKAVEVGEQLRKSIENIAFYPGRMEYTRKEELKSMDERLPITISLGITQMSPEIDKNTKSILNRSDQYLYKAKSAGKNVVYSDLDI